MSVFPKAMMNQTNATHLTTIAIDGSSVEEYLTTLAEAEDTGKAIFWSQNFTTTVFIENQ